VNREKTSDRHAKKKQKVLDEVFDDVNIFLADKKSTHNTTICTGTSRPPPQMAEEWRKLDYWDSGEAILLFNPIPGKSVKQCLCDRERLLQDIIDDARKVTTVIKDGDADKTPLNARHQQRIVAQCLYLRKAYENAIQHMNAWTWHKCCEEAIESIRDLGIAYVCNEKTIRRWHIFFRKNETFPNPRGYSKKLREPKVFDFFPEIKSMINDYCGNPDNQPSMSAESVAAEIRLSA
jgi:hypothetical protein